MARIHKMISLEYEQDKFIKEKRINISQFVQVHINNLMENNLDPTFLKSKEDKIKSLENQMQHWKGLFDTAGKFIENKGLINEFMDIMEKKGF